MRIERRPGSGITLLAIVLGTLMLAFAGSATARTVWLCKPGQHPDPCTPGLSTTVYSPTLHSEGVIHPQAAHTPKIDCFYVYPTVSDQKGPLANLHVDPEERSIALYQTARYSQLCRVFAPMYRQVTVPALQAGNSESPAELATPLADVRHAFADYLRHDNHGRGFVLIGHSQGASLLRLLIAKDVDRKPAVRARMLSAIALGGNVLVKRGRPAGGDFQNVPACRHATELGCVIAFSTYDQPPPLNSIFGRTTAPGDQVLCVNPAALIGARTLDPIFPSAPFAPGTIIAGGIALLHLTQPMPHTVWSTEPGAYRGRCSSAGGTNVLRISALRGAQVPTPSPDPDLGSASARCQHRARRPAHPGQPGSNCVREAAPDGLSSGGTRVASRVGCRGRRRVSNRAGRVVRRPGALSEGHCGGPGQPVQSRTMNAVMAADRIDSRSGRYLGEAPPSPAGPTGEDKPVRLPPAESVSPWLQTLRSGVRPIAFNLRHHRQFGDVWQISILARREGFVVTCHPDHVRSLLTAKPEDAPSLTGETQLRPILGENSILTSGARATCASASCCCHRSMARPSSATLP